MKIYLIFHFLFLFNKFSNLLSLLSKSVFLLILEFYILYYCTILDY